MFATLQFLTDIPLYQTEKPYKLLNFPSIPPELSTNCQYINRHGIRLNSVRGREDQFSVDQCGFQILKHRFRCTPTRSQFEDRLQRDHLVQEYLSEVVYLVKKELCADRVFCFDWRVRRTFARL